MLQTKRCISRATREKRAVFGGEKGREDEPLNSQPNALPRARLLALVASGTGRRGEVGESSIGTLVGDDAVALRSAARLTAAPEPIEEIIASDEEERSRVALGTAVREGEKKQSVLAVSEEGGKGNEPNERLSLASANAAQDSVVAALESVVR